MSDKKMSNCPFCGTAAKLIEKFIGDDVDSYWDVECTNHYCYLHGGAEWCFDTKAEAISKWNTRDQTVKDRLMVTEAELRRARILIDGIIKTHREMGHDIIANGIVGRCKELGITLPPEKEGV